MFYKKNIFIQFVLILLILINTNLNINTTINFLLVIIYVIYFLFLKKWESKIIYIIISIPFQSVIKVEDISFSIIPLFQIILLIFVILKTKLKLNYVFLFLSLVLIVSQIIVSLITWGGISNVLALIITILTLYFGIRLVEDFNSLFIYSSYGFIIATLISGVIPFIAPNIILNLIQSDSDISQLLLLNRYAGLTLDSTVYAQILIIALGLLTTLFIERKINISGFIILLISISILGFLTYSKTFLILFVINILLGIYYYYKCNLKFSVSKNIYLFLSFMISLFPIFILIIYKYLIEPVIKTRIYVDQGDLLTGRTEIWINYILYIKNNFEDFLFGFGYGTVPRLVSEKFDWTDHSAHNAIIEKIYELGFIGFILFALIIFSVFKGYRFNILSNPRCIFLILIFLSYQVLSIGSYDYIFILAILIVLQREIKPNQVLGDIN